jgi:peptidoglycan/LPS O-acetylase OafA/YrhL
LFYVLAPWLWRYWRFAKVLALASLAVQALAWFGVLPTDAWGYRLLPGVLWVFMAGMALQRYRKSLRTLSIKTLCLLPLAIGLLALGLRQQAVLGTPYNAEVLLGCALGLPAIQALTQWQALDNARFKVWDQRLGDLSYGIFLNHFLCMWVWGLTAPQTVADWCLLCGSSIFLSYVTQRFLERPSVAWRQQRRVTWQMARKALKIDA